MGGTGGVQKTGGGDSGGKPEREALGWRPEREAPRQPGSSVCVRGAAEGMKGATKEGGYQ